jgi:putative cell wall-binding protein
MLPFTGESYLSVGAGGTDTVDLVVTADTVERISGVDRYGTAAAASQDAYAPGVDTVYVATGTEFADALTGSALAGHQHAPILLVKPGSVPAVTAAELDRLNPASVVVLGGANSVSETVKTQVGSYAGGNVERIAGSERYATAAAVAQEFPAGDRVFVATGRQYADALAASAAAGAQGVPVLLVTQDSVPQATASALAELDPSFITLLGGTGSVSTGVATELGGYGEVTRVFGADRYATAAALSAQREGALGAVIATGVDFPDALTGAAYAAVANVPVLLVKPSSIPGATRTELDRLAARAVLVFGGTASVSEAVLTNLAEHNYAG